MGNYKFKLSELMPNAWFYKLRDMGKKKKNNKSKKQQNSTVSPSPVKKQHAVLTPTTTTARSPRLPSSLPPPRRSSHYNSRPGKTAPFSSSPPSDTPRKSAGYRRRHHRVNVKTKSSAPKQATNPSLDFSTTSGDSTTTGTGSFSPEFRSDQVLLPDESLTSSWQSPCSCVTSKLTKPELDLRPIITKQATKPTTTVKKPPANSPATGVRIKLRSPRVSTRKSVSKRNESSSSTAKTTVTTTASSRRSRAVVKASVNPRRDFKESMEEMILENNIRGSKDLEELLACYLCLNSDEYHQVIINVFKQIWIDLNLPIHISK